MICLATQWSTILLSERDALVLRWRDFFFLVAMFHLRWSAIVRTFCSHVCSYLYSVYGHFVLICTKFVLCCCRFVLIFISKIMSCSRFVLIFAYKIMKIVCSHFVLIFISEIMRPVCYCFVLILSCGQTFWGAVKRVVN